MRLSTLMTCAALMAAVNALAAEAVAPPPDDADALAIADATPVAAPPPPKQWRLFGEGAVAHVWWRDTASRRNEGRASFDLRYDGYLAPGLRAVLSDRIDIAGDSGGQRDTELNTVREAYLSWQWKPDLVADIGRINLRQGAAKGYNPTDFFKGGALRWVSSPDPASLRENRQGTVVIQGQKLWNGGSLTATYSPRIDRASDDSAFALNFAATNPRDRWLISGSQRFSETFNPQVLLHGGAGMSPQAGVNLSGLLTSATVAYLEASAGRGRSLIGEANALPEARRTQRRAVAGLSYTTGFNLTVTAEAQYNSAAPDREQWSAASSTGGPAQVAGLLTWAQTQQDLPVRNAWFFHASWRDMGIRSLDLSAYLRRDATTRSREQWLETRYHWNQSEVALQWLLNSGGPGSLYGAVPQQRRMDLVWRQFL